MLRQERDRICERVLGTMADQRKRGRFLGGTPSFGCVTVKNILSDARAKAARVIENVITDYVSDNKRKGSDCL